MEYVRMPMEMESPEEIGYDQIRYNLSESSVTDRKLSDLNLTIPDLTLLYGEHRGSEKLRALIASESAGLTAADVLIAGGAAGALFIIATALLRANDHLVVLRPNYATNLETPRAIGCEITHIDLSFENGFRMDHEMLAASIKPNTKLISITSVLLRIGWQARRSSNACLLTAVLCASLACARSRLAAPGNSIED